MINIGYQILQMRTSKYVSVFLLNRFVDPIPYRNAVQGVGSWYKFTSYHIRCPQFGVWMKSFCVPSGPFFFFLDLVSLALTKSRWTVVLILWMSHYSADKNGFAKVWESQPLWCRPPTVSTQRCTSSPLFYANSCGSFEESLCASDRSF